MELSHVLETAVYVSDLAEARDFYVGVLGLRVVAEQAGRHVFLRCGESMVLLFNPAETERPDPAGVPVHGARGPGHLAWAVSAGDMDAWRDRLAAHGVAIEHEHAWPHGGRSLYFRDPSGNSLELATASVWR